MLELRSIGDDNSMIISGNRTGELMITPCDIDNKLYVKVDNGNFHILLGGEFISQLNEEKEDDARIRRDQLRINIIELVRYISIHPDKIVEAIVYSDLELAVYEKDTDTVSKMFSRLVNLTKARDEE